MSVAILVNRHKHMVRVYSAQEDAEAKRDEYNADPFVAPGEPDPDAPYAVEVWEVQP